MSKRHQSTRRKTYGRRQHELHEREVRRHERDGHEDMFDAFGWRAEQDARGVFDLDLGAAGLRFAMGD